MTESSLPWDDDVFAPDTPKHWIKCPSYRGELVRVLHVLQGEPVPSTSHSAMHANTHVRQAVAQLIQEFDERT